MTGAREPTLRRTTALPSPFVVRRLESGAGVEDFLVGDVIGQGASSVVEFARQKSLDRDVILKRARDPLDQLARDEILREARVAARLQHPSIVTVHGVFTDTEGTPVICMQAAPGRTWPGLQETSWPLEEHVRIAIEVCRALEFAHARGILHLDLKPENIFVGSFGEVCLLDWGIALDRAVEPVREEVLGTPSYLAPEMASLEPLDDRTDVYLLGATLFRILFGRPPHRRDTPEASTRAACEPVAFPGVPPWMEELVAVCRRALEVTPEERYPSIRALRMALDATLRHRDSERLTHRARLAHELLPTSLAPDERLRELEAIRSQVRSALRLWPDNPRALAAQEAFSLELTALHLFVGDPEAAARRSLSLGEVPPDIARALHAATRRRAGRRARRQAAQLLDPAPSQVWRDEMLVSLFVLVTFVLGGATLVSQFSLAPASTVRVGEVLLTSIGWGAILWGKPPAVRHLFERSLFNTSWGALAGLAANRLVAEMWGLPYHVAAGMDLLLVAGVAGASSYIHRPMAYLGVVLAGCGAAMVLLEGSRPAFLVIILAFVFAVRWVNRGDA